MKLTVEIDLVHETLDLARLLGSLPLALESVARATSAGVAATGPDGMTIQIAGSPELARVHFRLRAGPTGRRIEDLLEGDDAPEPAPAPASPGEHAPG